MWKKKLIILYFILLNSFQVNAIQINEQAFKNNDALGIYASVKAQFKMIPCQGGYRRCGKAKVTIDQEDFIKLGSPVSCEFSYSKNHTLPDFNAYVFQPYEQYFVLSAQAEDKNTPSDGGYKFTLDKVCLRDEEGNNLSCSEFHLTSEPGKVVVEEVDFPNPLSGEDPVSVELRLTTYTYYQKKEFIYFRVRVSINTNDFLKINSPVRVLFSYHRSKDSVFSANFKSNGKGGYMCEKTDKANTVWAESRYSFILDKLCLKGKDDESDGVENRCVKAEITDGSYKGLYKEQILNIPINP